MSLKQLKPQKGHLSLYILLLLIVIGTMVMLRQCSSRQIGPRKEFIAGGDTINVAIEISPMGIYMTGDTLGGVYYDLMRNLCSTHNRQVRFHAFTQLEEAFRGLDEGRFQIVIADIPATTELKKRYLFIHPLGVDKQVLVQRRDSTGQIHIKDQFDLAKEKICLPKESPFIPRLHNLAREIGDTIYIAEDPEYSSEQLVILTALGEIPSTVVSRKVAEPLLEKYPTLDASVEISFNQFQSWALNPRDTILRDTINQWLSD